MEKETPATRSRPESGSWRSSRERRPPTRTPVRFTKEKSMVSSSVPALSE